MEIRTSEADILFISRDDDGFVRFTIDELEVAMHPYTAAVLAASIQQIFKGTYNPPRKPRQTKRPK